MKEFKLVATAASGIEALVGKELRDLGLSAKLKMVKQFLMERLKQLLKQIFGYEQLTE